MACERQITRNWPYQNIKLWAEGDKNYNGPFLFIVFVKVFVYLDMRLESNNY